MIDTIVQQLGADAPSLLDHVVTTIARDSLHLPGPDFVDRVWLDSDRPLPVIRNLQSQGLCAVGKVLKKRGVGLFGTTNDEGNLPMLSVNRKLGYVPEPPSIRMKKPLSGADRPIA